MTAIVGISVSDPDSSELERHGVTEDHLRHAFVEIVRQVFAAGHSIAYGGDLRARGFTETLVALLRTYSVKDAPAPTRVRQYLAHPAWKDLSAADLSPLASIATVVRVQPHGDRSGGETAGRARDFTAMRAAMTEETDARIAVGGRLHGQSGRWPGIVEEAYLAVRAARPLFVAGGLGGAAERLADAVRGDWPQELTDDYQAAHTEVHGELVDAGVGPSETELRETLVRAELRNGLEPEENALLLRTTDLDLLVALILRGLHALDD
jgi:SLOG cluster2